MEIRESQSMEGLDLPLLALKMEKGTMSQGIPVASRS